MFLCIFIILLLQETTLVIENKDTHDISFESSWEQKPHFQVQITPTVLRPGTKVSIPITFFPKTAIQYRDILPIHINGLNTTNIELSGEGVELKGFL